MDQNKRESDRLKALEDEDKSSTEPISVFKLVKILSLHDPRFYDVHNPVKVKPKGHEDYVREIAPPETAE